PLTGLFESMIVLTIAFGLAFLFLSVVIREVLFSSVMSWFLVVMILLTAVLTKPAEVAHPVAKMPWAIAHGMAMALGGAMVVFATAVAFLYLLANRRLKQKKLSKVLGRLPNFQKLEMLNLFGLKAGFVLLTFGLMSGVGMMAFKGKMIQTDIAQWFLDPKIVLIIIAWVLLGSALFLRWAIGLKGKAVAYVTMVAVFLILFAMLGVGLFCGTGHVFSSLVPENIVGVVQV
ncbi:MAG: cytochrome c biogenesis protein CcsA, partial [Planctomycetes bacterium]|nr:cytochrome c biogenesis protein CcsA [Planctomycetota bacterium]